MKINKHFNRVETDLAHLYMSNAGERDTREERYSGFLKCKLAHGVGFSIIVPDLILLEQPSLFWIQPLFFLPNLFTKCDDGILGRIYVDISCSQTLRVDFRNEGFVRRFEDGSELFKCDIVGPPDLHEFSTGVFEWAADTRILLHLYHHTTQETKQSILQEEQFRLSKWNIQGNKQIQNAGCVYFTCLPEILQDHDLNQIAMAIDGRILAVMDGADIPVTVPQNGGGPFANTVLEIPVYRESTLNRRSSIQLRIDAGQLSPQHIFRHAPPAQQVFYEITRPFIYRLTCAPNTHWHFDPSSFRGEYANVVHFDYIVIGFADTLEGLGAPFDEENTKHTAKIQRTDAYGNMLDFWFSEANNDHFSRVSKEQMSFEQ